MFYYGDFIVNLLNAGIKSNFFNYLLFGQVTKIVYLPGEISTCLKQRGTMHFDVA